MRWRIGAILDRIIAVGVGLFIFSLMICIQVQHDGFWGLFVGLFLGVISGAPPAILLWISKSWSLILVALGTLPWCFGAYVLCDIAGPGLATDVLHWAHFSAMWGVPYGVIRSLICIMGDS